MQNLSCEAMDTRDYYGRERFLPLSLESHLTTGLTDNTWFWEIHPSYYPLQQVYLYVVQIIELQYVVLLGLQVLFGHCNRLPQGFT